MHVRRFFPTCRTLAFSRFRSNPAQNLQKDCLGRGVTIGKIYRAMDGEGIPVGYVVEAVSSEGYGGNIVLYAGITDEGVLKDVSILSISETPGLGMRAEEVLVPQLHDKAVKNVKYVKTGASEDNEIDAISGATITTKAVTAAVNGALEVALELRGGEDNE